MGWSPPGPSVHGLLQARRLGWAAMPSSRDLPCPGRGPESPGLAAGFFTTQSPGKPPLAHRLHTGVLLLTSFFFFRASQAVLVVKTLPAAGGDVRDAGSIPGSGRSPGGGHGHPLQCSCPENPMDRGAWQAVVCGVPESQIQLKPLSTAATFFNFYLISLFFFCRMRKLRNMQPEELALVHTVLTTR